MLKNAFLSTMVLALFFLCDVKAGKLGDENPQTRLTNTIPAAINKEQSSLTEKLTKLESRLILMEKKLKEAQTTGGKKSKKAKRVQYFSDMVQALRDEQKSVTRDLCLIENLRDLTPEEHLHFIEGCREKFVDEMTFFVPVTPDGDEQASLQIDKGYQAYKHLVQTLKNKGGLNTQFCFDHKRLTVLPPAALWNKQTHLTHLCLNGNRIYDVRPIEGLKGLKTLWLFDNQISDGSPIARMVNLRDLTLSHNPLREIGFVKGLVRLERLSLRCCSLWDVTSLSGLVALWSLDLSYNGIVDPRALSTLVNLWELRLSCNRIPTLDFVSGLKRLSKLYLYQNKISDLSPLSTLEKLTYIQLGGNPAPWTPLPDEEKETAERRINKNRQIVVALRARGCEVNEDPQ